MRFETRRQVMDKVIDWLNYYNQRRLHSALNYISPMKFEQNWFMAQLKKPHNKPVKMYELPGHCHPNKNGEITEPPLFLNYYINFYFI